MQDFTRQIAKVRSVSLGWEDHGILTCFVHLDFGGSGEGFGGYAMDELVREGSEVKGRRGTAFGMQFVERVMRACGVDDWSKVAGRTVICLRDGDEWSGRIVGIAPLPTEPGEPFIIADLLAEHAAVMA